MSDLIDYTDHKGTVFMSSDVMYGLTTPHHIFQELPEMPDQKIVEELQQQIELRKKHMHGLAEEIEELQAMLEDHQ